MLRPRRLVVYLGGLGLLLDVLGVLLVRLQVHGVERPALQAVRHALLIVRNKVKPAQAKLLQGIDPVLPVQELNDGAVAVAYRPIVRHCEALQVLHEAPLEVPGAGRLDRRVNKPLAASHTMEEVLLRANAREEAAADEASRNGVSLECLKAGQRLERGHEGHTLALELLLPKEAADLRHVDLGPLGACRRHHLEVVLREGDTLSSRQDAVDGARGDGGEGLLSAPIQHLAPRLLV
mmetsp:Transcript_33553/g.82448  ORF Transcript_33553/g.82448 Transcript_33553/m.82448 type:complete len:236 (+) Transcript_33553:632-1339(+)